MRNVHGACPDDARADCQCKCRRRKTPHPFTKASFSPGLFFSRNGFCTFRSCKEFSRKKLRHTSHQHKTEHRKHCQRQRVIRKGRAPHVNTQKQEKAKRRQVKAFQPSFLSRTDKPEHPRNQKRKINQVVPDNPVKQLAQRINSLIKAGSLPV